MQFWVSVEPGPDHASLHGAVAIIGFRVTPRWRRWGNRMTISSASRRSAAGDISVMWGTVTLSSPLAPMMAPRSSILWMEVSVRSSHENGPTLYRDPQGLPSRVVYSVDPAPRPYESFAGMVRAHYTRDVLAPFVRLSGPYVSTSTSWSPFETTSTSEITALRELDARSPVAGFHALLEDRFHLPGPLVKRALIRLNEGGQSFSRVLRGGHLARAWPRKSIRRRSPPGRKSQIFS